MELAGRRLRGNSGLVDTSLLEDARTQQNCRNIPLRSSHSALTADRPSRIDQPCSWLVAMILVGSKCQLDSILQLNLWDLDEEIELVPSNKIHHHTVQLAPQDLLNCSAFLEGKVDTETQESSQ